LPSMATRYIAIALLKTSAFVESRATATLSICALSSLDSSSSIRTDIRDYIWLGGSPVAVVDNAISGSSTSSTVNYVTSDQLNTPRAVTNSAGTVIWLLPYQGNPFGEQQPTSGSGYVLNLRFPGQYYDAETGLVHNDHRDYCAACGRYIQSDPVGLFGGQISTYAYGNNDPLSNIDPLGLAQCALVFLNGNGSLQCTPDDPSNAPVNIPVASGNNGGGENCKNNPECQAEVGRGPIPSGCWEWSSGYTSKPNGRVLNPCQGWPDLGRTNIRSHSCANAFGPSKGPQFCSAGCVTGSVSGIHSLNKLLDAEPNSTLWVGSTLSPQIPSFDDSLPGKPQ